MDALELDGADDQLARAVEADANSAPVATRAAMRRRQGLDDSAPARERSAEWLRRHNAACQRSHEIAERLVRVICVLAAVAIWYGW